jgi:hypothetical protein
MSISEQQAICDMCYSNMKGYQYSEDPPICVDCHLSSICNECEVITGKNKPISCCACNGKVHPNYMLEQMERDGQPHLFCSPKCSKGLEIFGHNCIECGYQFIRDYRYTYYCDNCVDIDHSHKRYYDYNQ